MNYRLKGVKSAEKCRECFPYSWLSEKIVANVLVLLFLAVWWSATLPHIKLLLLLLLSLFFIDCTRLFERYDKYIYWMKILGLFIFSTGLRIGFIRANPPDIDIYFLADMEVENILHGVNPYLAEYPPYPGPSPYPPLFHFFISQ